VPLPAEIVAGLAGRLAEHAGLELPTWVIESRAQARMAALGVTPADYVELVGSARGAVELAELIELVRVGETRLFRHRSQVDALTELVAPALRRRPRPVRVWSAGCATGEEAYTLAIVLGQALPGHAVSILATDVSADALEIARAATYPIVALDHVPDAWRDGFIVEAGRIRVRPDLAALVRFERRNLVDPDPQRDFDLVWCRNVLIYFAPAARRRAIDRLTAALAPAGFLFVGYSESLHDVAELEAVRSGDATVYRRRAAPVVAAPPPPPQARRTPALGVPVAPDPRAQTVRVRAGAAPAEVTAELSAALAAAGLRRLVIDLGECDDVADDIAPSLRRARAAARAAGVELVIAAARTSARRWLRRHGLEDAP
jgi:chemotaxis protein methyltransferase CheR